MNDTFDYLKGGSSVIHRRLAVATPDRTGGEPMVRDLSVTVERDHFIDAMSRAVTGVTVVTTDGPLGRYGQTVSAMASVSADPPMLLVCINRRSPIRAAIVEHGIFGVNILRADQRRLAEIFAGRPRSGTPYDFDAARWDTGVTSAPLLAGSVARFDCAVEHMHEAGTHSIFVGRVLVADGGGGTPLVYAKRGYGELHAFPNRVPQIDDYSFDDDEASELELGEL